MKQEEKKLLIDSTEERIIIEENKQLLLESLVQQADALTIEEFNAKIEADEKIKHELIGGGFISIKEVKDLRAAKKQPYQTHFGYEKPFFKDFYRLKGWPDEEHRNFVKRKSVPNFIMRRIYALFPQEVVEHIKKENPIIFAYIRKHKYFQYIIEDGQALLDTYIENAMNMMAEYKNGDWDRFEFNYCVKNNLPVQLKLKLSFS